MLTPQQRLDAIYGLLLGVAIGDSLGWRRAGLKPQQSVRTLGFKPLNLKRRWPYRGWYSDDTQLALLAGQAILQSRSHSNKYHKQFARRLKWYALSLPAGITRGTFCAGLKCWLRFTGLPTGCWSAGSAPASRSLLMGVVLHNTGHRYLVWSRDTASATHRHPLALDGAMVLATAAQVAAVSNNGQLNSIAALKTIAAAAKVPSMQQALEQLEPFLQQRSSPRAVANHFGWNTGIRRQALPIATMSVYCFLRYPTKFEQAVKSALLLGGSSDTLAATVGGLVGIHIGADAIPDRLVFGLAEWPHDREWMKKLATRLASWPHGEDDLMFAPALPSYAIAQVLRNGLRKPFTLAHWLLRLPARVLG